MTRRTRLHRLRTAVETAAVLTTVPSTEVWLPAKDGGGGAPPGRYPQPGGRMVLVIYRPDVTEATA